MKKNSNYFLILFSFFLLISCGSDDSPVNEPEVVPPQTKDISFSFDVAEISNKDAHKNKGVNETLLNKVIVDAASVVITIQDESNAIIYNREKLDLTKVEDTYISSSISLDFGSYTITEFIVLDAQDNAIYLTPKDGSDMAPNVTEALPISLTIGTSSDEQITFKVLDTNNLTADDFGYTNFDFTILGEFTFVIDQTDELSTLNFNIEPISDNEYIIDWGDGTTDIFIPSNSVITHDYALVGKYTVTVTGNIGEIEVLFIQNKGLLEVDLSKLGSLTGVFFQESQLTSLNVASNPLLDSLILSETNSQLTSIDLSNNPELTLLWLDDNQLTSIDLSSNPLLNNLRLMNNELTSIDLSSNPELINLNLSNNQLTSLDVSFLTKLVYLDVSFMQSLTDIDLSSNTELENLYMNYSYFTDIDISSNTKLKQLWLSSSEIATLDISNNPHLNYLYIVNNQISDIEEMESLYNQLLTNVKANNIVDGRIASENNVTASQAIIDIANELTNDYNWEVTY